MVHPPAWQSIRVDIVGSPSPHDDASQRSRLRNAGEMITFSFHPPLEGGAPPVDACRTASHESVCVSLTTSAAPHASAFFCGEPPSDRAVYVMPAGGVSNLRRTPAHWS